MTNAGADVSFTPTADYCGSASFDYTLTGGDTASVTVTVTCFNDAPVVTTSAGDTAYTEDGPAVAVDNALTVTDVDDTNIESAQVSITSGFESGDDLAFTDTATIDGTYTAGTGVLTLTGSDTKTNYEAALRSVAFSLTDDTPSASREIEFKVSDGDAEFAANKDIAVTPNNDAPVADNETFNGNDSAHGNTTLEVDDPSDVTANPSEPHTEVVGDILDGDDDVDGPAPLTVTPGTLTTYFDDGLPAADVADGGSVTIEADGDFTFRPGASTSCTNPTSYFDYTLEDSHPTDEETDTGRVTIALAGCVWYVNNNDSGGNDGTSQKPYDTLVQAESASGANHTVFVYDGDNSSTGYDTGFAMNSGERLLGEHEGLVVDQGVAYTADTLLAANAGAKPTLTASGEDVVALDDGNEVRGFVINPSGSGGGIAGASGDTGGGTIDDIDVNDTNVAGTQPGVELDSTTGTFALSNITVDNGGAAGAKGIAISSAGSVGITGTNSIDTDGAEALDVSGTTITALDFGTVTSANSASEGIDLSGIGATNFTPTGGSITNAGGTSFRLNGGSGTVTYPGNIGDGGGITAIDVSNRTGGDVTLSGTISDDGDAGGRITVGGSGGTTTLSGSTKQANTGATDAILFNSSNGHTLNLTNGGLDIDTAGGKGLEAENSGAITVTTGPSPNTIDTGSGRGLHISDTDIGSDDVTFRSISSNGASNGIRLNNTGSSGNLSVTGNGGTCDVSSPANCTGGTIVGSTDDGIDLTSTHSPSFVRMGVKDSANAGVYADAVTGLSIDGFELEANGVQTESSSERDHNVFIEDLLGTANEIKNSDLHDARNTNLHWEPVNSGANTLTVTDSKFNSAGEGPSQGNSGINLSAVSSANVKLVVTGGQVINNAAAGIQVNGVSGTTVKSDISGVDMVSSVPPVDQTTWGNGAGTNFGIALKPNGTSVQQHRVANNTIAYTGIAANDQSAASALSVNIANNSGNFDATITGNTIGLAGVTRSGNENFYGIVVGAEDAADAEIDISNNVVHHTAQRGIYVYATDFTPDLADSVNVDLTLRNNNVTAISNDDDVPFSNLNGMFVESNDDSNLCLDMVGNDSASVGSSTTTGTEVRLRQIKDPSLAAGAIFRLERLPVSTNNELTVETFVNSENPLIPTAEIDANVFPIGGAGYTAVADGTCQHPTLP